MKSSYLRSIAWCSACSSRRLVSNFSVFGSRTMGVITFMAVLPKSLTGLRGVDALMRRDTVAGHGLPHGQLEQLHVHCMEEVGGDDHGIGDGDAAGVGGQQRAHAALRLDRIKPHCIGD